MGRVGNLWSSYTTFAVVRVVQGKARYDIIFVVSQALPEESKLPLLNCCCKRSRICSFVDSFIGDVIFFFDPMMMSRQVA